MKEISQYCIVLMKTQYYIMNIYTEDGLKLGFKE